MNGATRFAIGTNDLLPLLQHDRIVMDRRERISLMATALRTYQATGGESDAIRCLMGRGFPYGEIVAYLDNALYEARQDDVAAIVKAG